MPIRVVVADDSYLIREAVSRLVDDESDLCVVATAADVDSLLAAVDQNRPSVVVTDVRMPPAHRDEGVLAAERIREAAPQCGVVVLSQYVRREYAVRLFERGAGGRGYLLKDRVGRSR
jgi:DNA-binding NarL/FixJ family response regulator